MNNDIIIMIRLQEYWDIVMSSRAAIERSTAGIRAVEKELASKKSVLDRMEVTVKELKTTLKQHELDLADMAGRIKKLEGRRMNIHTERELKALDKEIEVLTFDSTSLEEKTLALIDQLDETEKEYARMEIDYRSEADRLSGEKPAAEKEISRHEGIIRENEALFNELAPSLSAAHRSKFLKIIGARDGKAIARVEGEICGYCNRKIPASLAIDSGKDDKIVNCSNCGKFIYR